MWAAANAGPALSAHSPSLAGVSDAPLTHAALLPAASCVPQVPDDDNVTDVSPATLVHTHGLARTLRQLLATTAAANGGGGGAGTAPVSSPTPTAPVEHTGGRLLSVLAQLMASGGAALLRTDARPKAALAALAAQGVATAADVPLGAVVPWLDTIVWPSPTYAPPPPPTFVSPQPCRRVPRRADQQQPFRWSGCACGIVLG